MATINHKIKQLRREVQGYYPRIAKKANVSTVTISKVLNGHYVNLSVIEAAIKVRDEVREEEKQKTEELSKQVSKI